MGGSSQGLSAFLASASNLKTALHGAGLCCTGNELDNTALIYTELEVLSR